MTLNDIWAFGVYDLRLNDDQLWGLTLKEFFLLVNRWQEEQSLTDRRFGRICAVLANVNRDSKKKAFNEEDFMPKQKKEQSVEEQKAILTRIGGKK